MNTENKFVYDLKQIFQDNKVFLSFSGPMSESLLGGIVEAIKKEMDAIESTSPVFSKVFSIIVEVAQNIKKFSDETVVAIREGKEVRVGCGIITIGQDKDQYVIGSGNMITNKKLDDLTSYIDTLNKMSLEELKKYYRNARKKGEIDIKGGAHLGVITIAMYTKKPIEYHITKVNNNQSFLSCIMTL